MTGHQPDWRAFVRTHGWRVRAAHLALVLGQPVADIARARTAVTPRYRARPLRFSALFAAWHGRPPHDDEWPAPTRQGSGYEWLAPELALVARLIGTMGLSAIADLLTTRLRRLTGDATARRNVNMVRCAMQRLGLLTGDVLGGITIAAAGREIGTRAILDHHIRQGTLRVRRVGRYLVIPHDVWAAWKASRVHPPAGYVRLRSIRDRLAIRHDKLSEYARMGYIPTAVCCNTYGVGERSTRWGTWYLDPTVAKRLLADRRAGRPMPWHGKPMLDNLRVTWRRWHRRQHPARCATCRQIWGRLGAPTTFDDYVRRYPPLAFGAKRHLTRPYSDGLTLAQVAIAARMSPASVYRAVRTGMLRATRVGRTLYVTRTDSTRWRARKCPTGESAKSWLTLPTACRRYGFTARELQRRIRAKQLRVRIGTAGPQRGVLLVSRQQVSELRARIGFTEAEAARRVGVSVARLRVLLRGLNWRGARGIPLDTVDAAKKRQASAPGLTLAAAARQLRKSVAWVRQEIAAGTIRPLRVKWDRRRLYVSAPMFRRLQAAARRQEPPRRPATKVWISLSTAATHAGVSTTTVWRWAHDDGSVSWRELSTGRHVHRQSLEARARRYWRDEVRFKRKTPPAWLETAA